MCLVTQFCKIDDFCIDFEPKWNARLISYGAKSRNRECSMPFSERMMVVIMFHQSGYRTFKEFYISKICGEHKHLFRNVLSYNRFVELMPSILVPMTIFLYTQRGKCTGISYVDSTILAVCLKARASKNKVFKTIASWGRSSVDWFYGLKLHIIVNDKGELLAFNITTASVDDRAPLEVMSHEIFGKLFGDRGYISSKLFEKLVKKGIYLFTTTRKNMKNKMMDLADKVLLRKRVIVETVNDQLKNISQIEHSRHRSVINCFLNILAGLAAYCFQKKKPSLNMKTNQIIPITV